MVKSSWSVRHLTTIEIAITPFKVLSVEVSIAGHFLWTFNIDVMCPKGHCSTLT